MGCSQSVPAEGAGEEAGTTRAPAQKEAELIDRMKEGIECKTESGSAGGYMRGAGKTDKAPAADPKERARKSLIGVSPTFLLRVDPAADAVSLSDRVDEQLEGDAAKASDKVRQRKMMLSQCSETFMVHTAPEDEEEVASDPVAESEDPKARARKGMIGRNPTILLRVDAEEGGDLAGRVEEKIEKNEPPDPKSRAKKFMIGRNPTLQDVHDMMDRDEVVRMAPEEEAAALDELRDAGLISSGENFIICTGSAAMQEQRD